MDGAVLCGGLVRVWKDAATSCFHATCTHKTSTPILTSEEWSLCEALTPIPPTILIPITVRKMMESIESRQLCSCKYECEDVFMRELGHMTSGFDVHDGIWRHVLESVRRFVDVHIEVVLDETDEECAAFVRILRGITEHSRQAIRLINGYIRTRSFSMLIRQEGMVEIRNKCKSVPPDLVFDMVIARGGGDRAAIRRVFPSIDDPEDDPAAEHATCSREEWLVKLQADACSSEPKAAPSSGSK